jgi:acyl carrier protein phosphodiesterase
MENKIFVFEKSRYSIYFYPFGFFFLKSISANMNFLAHIFLSGNDNEIMIGNFIADYVKGKSYSRYKPKIQKGILLHRKIDEFTDKHEITKNLAILVKSKYKRHSGIVIDIFYDHFLCQNWYRYSSIPLDQYINNCHRVLLRNLWILPSTIKGFLPVLIAKNRLLSYSKVGGIQNALQIMSKYTSLPAESTYAIEILNANYKEFNDKFLIFFAELVLMVNRELSKDLELI